MPSCARRALAGLAVLAAVAATEAQVAWAGTVKVDDDRAQCPDAGFRTISAALARARPGGVIFVCPGTYVEQLHMTTDGVSVLGLTRNPADVVLRPPDRLTGPSTAKAMVDMAARDTILFGVTLHGPAPRSVGCDTFVGILMRNGLGFNSLSTVVEVTLRQIVSSNCPTNGTGVEVGTADGLRPANAVLERNTWTGYGNAIVINPGSQADVRTNVIGARSGRGVAPTAGISARGATVEIRANRIFGFTAAARTAAGDAVSSGILLGPGVAGSVGTEADGSPAGNDIADNFQGLTVDSRGVVVANNTVHDNVGIGILAEPGSARNRFLHNVATHNHAGEPADCVDLTATATTAAANTWIGNIGFGAFPPGICFGGIH